MLKIKRQILIFNFYTILLISLIACNGIFTSENDDTVKNMRGTIWELETFETPSGYVLKKNEFLKAPSIECYSIKFLEDGTIIGNASTNEIVGVYQIFADNCLKIDSLGTTLVGLPEGSKYREYYNALKNVCKYELTEDSLTLIYSLDNGDFNLTYVGGESE